MENQYSALRFPMFHGMGKEDEKKNWLICEAILLIKGVTNDAAKITKQETMFRDRTLTWYMKYKATASSVHVRSLAKIKHDILRMFQNMKSKSHCITEIKEIKQKEGETM
jgi:hypothetical protein